MIQEMSLEFPKCRRGPRATLWVAPRSSALDLGTLPGHGVSEALSISESGDVVGSSREFTTTPRRALGSRGHHPRSGGNRHFSRRRFEPGAGHQQGPGRWNLGDQQWTTCILLWTDAGGMQDLNSLLILRSGFMLTQAVSIWIGKGSSWQSVKTTTLSHEKPFRIFMLVPAP